MNVLHVGVRKTRNDKFPVPFVVEFYFFYKSTKCDKVYENYLGVAKFYKV